LATTILPNTGLSYPAVNDTGYAPIINADFALLDGMTPLSSFAVQAKESPSASLNVKIAAGAFIQNGGAVGTYAGTPSRAMAASATNYLYLDGTAGWALVVNQTGFPATYHIRIAIVVSGAATITSIADARVCYSACGT
jgi:hypothetical protein